MTKYEIMTKYETINYKTLKTIMKLSISIGVELGFYLSCDGTITIDKYDNCDSNKTQIYRFSLNDAENIARLVQAYAKLFDRPMTIR